MPARRCTPASIAKRLNAGQACAAVPHRRTGRCTVLAAGSRPLPPPARWERGCATPARRTSTTGRQHWMARACCRARTWTALRQMARTSGISTTCGHLLRCLLLLAGTCRTALAGDFSSVALEQQCRCRGGWLSATAPRAALCLSAPSDNAGARGGGRLLFSSLAGNTQQLASLLPSSRPSTSSDGSLATFTYTTSGFLPGGRASTSWITKLFGRPPACPIRRDYCWGTERRDSVQGLVRQEDRGIFAHGSWKNIRQKEGHAGFWTWQNSCV